MQPRDLLAAVSAELLEGAAYGAHEFALACGVSSDWVIARVEAGVLQVDNASGTWRFDSFTVVRARRLVQLETTYDADPQLAALTTDLIEEVTRLRRQLEAFAGVHAEIVCVSPEERT
jgi:chaperone modulatory protein CbpM